MSVASDGTESGAYTVSATTRTRDPHSLTATGSAHCLSADDGTPGNETAVGALGD